MGYYYCYTTLCKDLPSDKQLATILLSWCKCMKSEMLKTREACSCKHMPITQFALLDGDMSLTDEPCKVLHSHTSGVARTQPMRGHSVGTLRLRVART